MRASCSNAPTWLVVTPIDAAVRHYGTRHRRLASADRRGNNIETVLKWRGVPRAAWREYDLLAIERGIFSECAYWASPGVANVMSFHWPHVVDKMIYRDGIDAGYALFIDDMSLA